METCPISQEAKYMKIQPAQLSYQKRFDFRHVVQSNFGSSFQDEAFYTPTRFLQLKQNYDIVFQDMCY